jgi:hypothetical protein
MRRQPDADVDRFASSSASTVTRGRWRARRWHDTRLSPAEPRDSTAFELRDALAQPGCAICTLALRSVGRYIDSVAYDRVNDLDLRAQLRVARGFCNPHAYRWLRDAHNVLGTALIYRDVVRSVLTELGNQSQRTRGGLFDRLRGRAADGRARAGCPACAVQREAEQRYLSALAAILHEAADAALFEASDGVCLTHALASARRGDGTADIVVRHSRARAERLVATLDEVIRKEDYRFRHEPRSEAERTAGSDVIAWTSGAQGLTQEFGRKP